MKDQTVTKEVILKAAMKVFYENGFKGARTSEIAQVAGISRTSLHYHYNTKEALFQAVLTQSTKEILIHFNQYIKTDTNQNLSKVIDQFVDALFDLFLEQPGLPSFVVNMLNERPELVLHSTFGNSVKITKYFEPYIQQAKSQDKISSNVSTRSLVIKIFGLCASPFLVKNYAMPRAKEDEAGYSTFLEEYRQSIKSLIFNSFFKK